MSRYQKNVMIFRRNRLGQTPRQDRHGRCRCKPGARHVGALLGLAVLCCGLILSGCTSGPHEAEAQPRPAGGLAKKIETFIMDPTSFLLLANRAPIVEVQEGTTTYTLQSDGDVSFRLSSGATQSIDLENNDMVIERPFASTVTVMRDR